MPTVPTTYLNPTGKGSVLSSINDWLKATVPSAGGSDFTYVFTAQRSTSQYPMVQVKEFTFFDPGFSYYDDMAFPTADVGLQQKGHWQQLMLDINIYTSQDTVATAKRDLMRIRDRLYYGLTAAGKVDANENLLIDPIKVNDESTGNYTQTNAYIPSWLDNHIIEHYYPPESDQINVHRYQMLVRVLWWELYT